MSTTAVRNAGILQTGAAVSRATGQTSAERRLEVDEECFKQNFDRVPFLLRHNLAGHPLFELPRLVELSRKLRPGTVEYSSGSVPIGLKPELTPRTGLSIQETIERIQESGSWMVLKYVEQDPDYRELLNRCLDEIVPLTRERAPGMCRREGFIFISSPGSITPYHLDPEYNFLLQVRGQKAISIFDPADRRVISEEELENYYYGSHRNLEYLEALQGTASVFDLTPGIGLFFPVTAPHWVKNGEQVSISFSVTFRSRASEKRSVVYTVNRHLRRLGLKPTPAGESAWLDFIKYNGVRVMRRSRRIVRSLRPGVTA
ncbi:MAG TPA: transcription factor [Blastocatellia bacterium]|nr:transcription factor [Blastocatellia bacterium]